MYELMWDVSSFADKSIWPTDGSRPFIYSMNIGGPAAHGDYVFGWKGDTLQKAMDSGCNLNKDCNAAGIHAQTDSVYSACTKPQQAKEEVDGCKFSLYFVSIPSFPHGSLVSHGLWACLLGDVLRQSQIFGCSWPSGNKI
jgi:hypothetical protein